MSTAQQNQANRANSQWSTGPRTEQGKFRSSQNARKHGLTAQQLTIKPEEREEFEDLLAHYQSDINPEGSIQLTLFDELVTAAWNLRRVRILQSQTDMLDPQYDRLGRHQARIERTIHRSLKELKALQTESTLHALLPRPVRHRTPFLAASLVVAKRSQQRERERLTEDRFPNRNPDADHAPAPAASVMAS
jgi:hypothetical protein